MRDDERLEPKSTVYLEPTVHGNGSIRYAVEQMVGTGQRLLEDQVALFKLDLKETAQHKARGSALSMAAAVLALLGYIMCLAALVVVVARWLGYPLTLLVFGLLHLTGAFVCGLLGWRSLKRNAIAADAQHLSPGLTPAEPAPEDYT